MVSRDDAADDTDDDDGAHDLVMMLMLRVNGMFLCSRPLLVIPP
jgi:hypothetical protein